MELKPGYKRTEVGVIPEEWEVSTANDVCERVVDCKNRTPPIVADSDYAVVRTPNVRDGKFVINDLRFTDEASYREWTARAIPQSGDIMITREAPLGEVCAVPRERKVCLGQRMMLYRPAPTKTDSIYLLFSLMSLQVRANLLKKIGGSTVGHAKVDDIRFLQLPIPPLPEQRAIAEALSDVDALLDGLDRLIVKKRDLKQAAMQQLLTGQTRLPGFAGNAVKQSEIGMIPEDWEIVSLGDHADITKLAGFEYTNHFNSYQDEGEIIVVRGTNITNNILDLSDIKTIPTSTSRKLPRSKLNKGDLVFAYVGTIGPVYLIEENDKYHLGPNTAKITCKAGLSNTFLFTYFTSELIKNEITEKITLCANIR